MRQTLLILFIFCACQLQAQKNLVYHLDSNRQVHDLRPFTYLLADLSTNPNEATILDGTMDEQFVLLNQYSQKDRSGPYWLRFRITAATPVNKWHLLLRDIQKAEGYTAQNDYVQVWYYQNKQLLHKEITGALVPRSRKAVHPVAGFNGVLFSIAPGDSLDVYIKVTNTFYNIPGFSYVEIVNPVIPAIVKTSFTSLMSALSTTAFVFCILSLFFYFFIKEKAYLFFALYTLVLSQHYLILHPDMPFIDRFIPEHPQLVTGFWPLFTVGGFILFCVFGKWFMNLSSLSPAVNKWFTRFLWIWASITILDAATLMVRQKNLIPEVFTYAALAIMMAFIIRFAFFRSVLAKLYTAGSIWLFIFTALGLSLDAGAITLPVNPWPVGQVGQLLIYAAGLAYKVRLNEKARAEANRIREMDTIKSKFFANISHEFRTPLTLIQGPLQQIEEQVSDQNKQNGTVAVPWRQLKTMRRNTDRLLELVNQLLDLSRLDAGSMKLQIIKGDVLQLLKTIAASFDSLAERKQIHYHIHFPEQSPIVFFDKDKLEKIFTNLLGNAFKYTPEQGAVSINITMEENRLRLLIEDNGPGIPKKELDKVFDRFYQVEGTEDKGSGIGLALVKELVELYRGQISVSSEPGKGSRFRVSIPMDKNDFKENEFIYGQYQAEPVFVSRDTYPEQEAMENSKFNNNLPLLLIVEDNADLRTFIKETVSGFYQVEQATNGKEGLEKAIALVPDIIISDVMMPQMDGFTMTEKIKKDERSSHIPVILLTAKAGQQHKIEGLETGADDYLTKPFDAKELLTRIENLINQRKLLRKKFAGTIQLKPSEVAVKSLDEIFLANVMQTIEKNMEEDEFGVEELAKKVAMSRSQLHRKLVALIDKSPSDLIRQTRLLRAKELLEKKAFTPSEVAFKVGFNSHTYFSKCFKDEFGVSPSEVI